MTRPAWKLTPMQWLYCLTALVFIIKVLLLPNPRLDYPGLDIVKAIVAESGVPNAVTGIIFRNRLYDTVFEVLVFTMAIMGANYLMSNEKPLSQIEQFNDQPSIVLARLGAPLAALVSIDLASRGHLSPGGGFAAGVAGGTAIGLVAITSSPVWMQNLYQRWNIATWEKISVLVFIVLSGLTLMGLALPLGELGTLVSGGMIPILNILVAFKVALGSWAAILIFIRYRGLL